MKDLFNFEQPITTYEFIAIVLSVVAIVVPILKWVYDKFIKKLKIDFLPSGMISMYYNKSGSYISFGGVYEAKNKSTTIKDISAKIIRKSDNATLSLIWSCFPSPIFRKVAGNFESSFETAHPFKVEADTLAPAFVEFENASYDMNEVTNNILRPVVNASIPILAQPDIGLYDADAKVKALKEYNDAKIELNDNFFWKSGKYELIIITKHSKGTFEKKYLFKLSDKDNKLLKENIDNLLVLHIAEHFRLSVPMNSVKKEFQEK